MHKLLVEQEEQQQSADIFNKLKVRKDQVPIRPLTEGKLEWKKRKWLGALRGYELWLYDMIWRS